MKIVSKLFIIILLLLVGSHAFAQKNHEYVDLGLPSGTLWATCNVGANKPEDFGNYYAWGETKTKSTYSWKSYKYANGNWDKLTKYCNKTEFGYNGFTDNLKELQTGDDPASFSWGNGWRTPSKAQWEELLKNTTNKWTTRNGVSGRLFTAKNGQTLFLPAAKYCDESDPGSAVSYGDYWSRSLDTDVPSIVWYLTFYSGNLCSMGSCSRYCGLSVRPVRSSR